MEDFGFSTRFDELTEQYQQERYQWMLEQYPEKVKRGDRQTMKQLKIPLRKHLLIGDKLMILWLRYGALE
jgi:hypothetical protein